MSVAFPGVLDPGLQGTASQAHQVNGSLSDVREIARSALSNSSSTRASKTFSLKKLTRMFLRKERERALSLFFREDKRSLSDGEKETVLRQRNEFQRSFEDAWKHLDFWIRGLGTKEGEAEICKSCLVADPASAAKAALLIRECFPALYYYCLPEDSKELNRFICSFLSERILEKDEMETIESMLISLPLNDLPSKESSEADRQLFKQPGISSVQEAAQDFINQFVMEFLEGGKFTLEFGGFTLSGESCKDRVLSLKPFFNQLKQVLQKMMQEGDGGLFLNIEERYPFDPGFLHHKELQEIADLMKFDRTFVENTAWALPDQEEKIAVFPLKMTWLIISSAVFNYYMAKRNMELLLQRRGDSPVNAGQRIAIEKVEMILHNDLNGMIVRAEGLGVGVRAF